MKLLIDAGNSRTKWVWCPSVADEASWQFHALENAQWSAVGGEAELLRQAVLEADEVWLSNVAGERWLQGLPAMVKSLHVIQAEGSALGLKNHYSHPAQLGSDRWCSLLSAWQQFGQSALVVTAGTAMTIDALLVNKHEADFLGGSIQPGLRLMWQSLQQGAAQLDYSYAEGIAWQDFALNSQQAMWLGCVKALTAPIAMQYARLSEQAGTPPLLLLSGGDAQLLHRYLPHALSAQAIIVDNLVLKGLACLAENTDE
ncbi:type III pantothenate kinase [Methylophilus sp.]|uniref:type III pantothenate kinase n=1 Tax=Methylophilus sp. TaxID=29541 RepID=UPI000D458BAA|nr:type III pantothenate kinase [Methylophilus sp.]PPD11436.1 MAG: type III pantothenate kinase [Methylophilus sp.]